MAIFCAKLGNYLEFGDFYCIFAP